MHRHAKPLVDTLAGVVARHILHRAWAEQARAIERTKVEEHLIERGQISRRSVATTTGHTGTPESWSIALGKDHMLTTLRALVSASQVLMQGIRHPNPQPVESEWLRDVVTDILTVVLAGNGLDEDRLYPVGGSAVIFDPCSWLPFQGEVTDLLTQPVVVFPCRRGHVGIGKAGLMGQHLGQGYLSLAVFGKLWNVIG